jgi:hypothetical protein
MTYSARDPCNVMDQEWKERAHVLERARIESAPSPGWHVHPYTYGGTPQSRLMDRFQSAILEH